MDFCHLKNCELEKKLQKYDGKVVLRVDTVKNDSGFTLYWRSKVLQRHTWRRQKSWTLFQYYPVVLDQQVMLWAHTHKSKLKTHHNFFIFRMKLSKDLDQITESRKTTHRLGTQLTIQLHRWSAIFTVTHCLDSDGRQHLRNVDEEGLEKSHRMVLPITSSQNVHNSCQCVLATYRWQGKLRSCWRCGPHCKRRSIWKTNNAAWSGISWMYWASSTSQ